MNVKVWVCMYVGSGALHGPVRHKACRRTHSPAEPRVARQLLWFPVGRGLTRVHQGNAAGQHSPEPASLCPDCNQVPRTADDPGTD